MPSRLAAALLWLLPAAVVADSTGHPVTMWLAEGASNRVYLLGSVHLLREQDHPLPQAIERAYDDAETLYMELDMDDLDPLVMQATVNRLGMLEEGTSLREVMGEALYADAMTAATELDIPLEMLERTEPWYAAITVEQLVLSRIGFNPLYGVEMHLLGKATGDGKEILGFIEDVRAQVWTQGLDCDQFDGPLQNVLQQKRDLHEAIESLHALPETEQQVDVALRCLSTMDE